MNFIEILTHNKKFLVDIETILKVEKSTQEWGCKYTEHKWFGKDVVEDTRRTVFAVVIYFRNNYTESLVLSSETEEDAEAIFNQIKKELILDER